MTDFLHLLGFVGVTLIVTRGGVMSKVRKLAPKFLSCPQCVGWWIGFLPTMLEESPTWAVALSVTCRAVLVGGAVSLLSSLSEAILSILDEVILKLQGKPGLSEPVGK